LINDDDELLIEEMLEEDKRICLDESQVKKAVENDIKYVIRNFINKSRALITHDLFFVLQASQIGDVHFLRKGLNNLNYNINWVDVYGDIAIYLNYIQNHISILHMVLKFDGEL
jgi:hypothetical protein